MFDRRSLAVLCAFAAPYAACLAQPPYSVDSYFDNRWYITPFGAYVLPDSVRGPKNGWGVRLAVGKPISPNWKIE